MKFLYIGIAGFGGAILRVLLGKGLYLIFPNKAFPLPTLIINLLGSYLLALFLVAFNKNINLPMTLKVAISTGFLGSFTTFSTFSIETIELLQKNSYGLAIIYILISFAGGFIFSFLGMKTISSAKSPISKLREDQS